MNSDRKGAGGNVVLLDKILFFIQTTDNRPLPRKDIKIALSICLHQICSQMQAILNLVFINQRTVHHEYANYFSEKAKTSII